MKAHFPCSTGFGPRSAVYSQCSTIVRSVQRVSDWPPWGGAGHKCQTFELEQFQLFIRFGGMWVCWERNCVSVEGRGSSMLGSFVNADVKAEITFHASPPPPLGFLLILPRLFPASPPPPSSGARMKIFMRWRREDSPLSFLPHAGIK